MKIRYLIVGSILTIIIYLIVNIVLVINNNEVLYIRILDNYDEEIESIDKRIEKIKNEECRTSLSLMSNNIKKTTFKENTTVDEFYYAYFDDDVFLDIYKMVEDKCSIEEDNSRYVLALSSYTFPDSVKMRFNLRHEFTFKDKGTRVDIQKQNDEVGSYTSKVLELRVIKELLECIKK